MIVVDVVQNMDFKDVAGVGFVLFLEFIILACIPHLGGRNG